MKRRHTAYVAIFVLVFAGLSLCAVNYYSIKILSGIRAYVSGDGQWQKAQKQATMSLIKYIEYRDQEYYERFLNHLLVIEGDRRARNAMYSDSVNYDVVRKGFIQGQNRPEDIDYLIWLFRTYRDTDYIRDPVEIWMDGDAKVAQLKALGQDIHKQIQAGELNKDEEASYHNKIYELDDQLTLLETNFAQTFSEKAGEIREIAYLITMGGVGVLLFLGIMLLFFTHRQDKLLKLKEFNFRNILDNSRDAIYQLDMSDGKFDFVSQSIENMLQYSVEEVKNGGPEFFSAISHPDDIGMVEVMSQHLKDYQKGQMNDPSGGQLVKNLEYRVKRKDGEYIWINSKRNLVYDDDSNFKAMIGNIREVTERKEREEQLEQAIKRNKALVRETHHRVKNNLTIIVSILMLQQEMTKNEYIAANLQDSINRLRSVAKVHEILYQSEQSEDIRLEDYLKDLFRNNKKAYSLNKEICFDFESDIELFHKEHSIHFGLLMNELMTNSFKHAFDDREEGQISIHVKRNSDNKLKIRYEDNGSGLSQDAGFFDDSESFGMQLVMVMMQQMKAEYSFPRDCDGFALEFDLFTQEG
jgi:PAS domain S-box-containing protein